MASRAPRHPDVAEPPPPDEHPICGVIMPISETASHSEGHWQSVQTLLHRAISLAGFEPRNVWESTATDRISERIIGNIFQVPIAIADITDLNPNVMLELGLRLASKKPTIVIATTGSSIPFDIRDFHASFYPADMNMLGMEDFFRKIAKVLQEKMAAVKAENYTPFLGSVIVDVASPETREVGVNDLLLSRFDEVSRRLIALETSLRRPRVPISTAPSRPRTGARGVAGTLHVVIPSSSVDDFLTEAIQLFEVDNVNKKTTRGAKATLEVEYSGASDYADVSNKINEIAEQFGGEVDVPF